MKYEEPNMEIIQIEEVETLVDVSNGYGTGFQSTESTEELPY